MKVKLDAKTAARLKLPDGKSEEIYWDETLPCFGLRLRRGSGSRINRTWLTQYRAHGRTRRPKIGSAEKLPLVEARKAAQKILAKVELGHDPQGEKVTGRLRAAQSLDAVVESYLEAKKPDVRPGTFRGMRRYLTGPYFKPLHSTTMADITLADVAVQINRIKSRGTGVAMQARSALSSLYVWAMGEGLVSSNPVAGTHKLPGPGPRERALSLPELATIWRVCGDDDYGRIVRLLILLGCRRQEVGGMRWSELDLAKGVWVLPKDRAKNKRELLLPLPPAALSIIKSVPRREGRDHLFGVRAAGFVRWSGGKGELDGRLGSAVQSWRIHDLRRSFSTGLNELGILPHIVEVALNHYAGHRAGVAGVYNRAPYEREVRDTLKFWAEHVLAVVEGREAKIVSLRAS